MPRKGYGYTPIYTTKKDDWICGVGQCEYCKKWWYSQPNSDDIFCTYRCFGKYKMKERLNKCFHLLL